MILWLLMRKKEWLSKNEKKKTIVKRISSFVPIADGVVII